MGILYFHLLNLAVLPREREGERLSDALENPKELPTGDWMKGA